MTILIFENGATLLQYIKLKNGVEITLNNFFISGIVKAIHAGEKKLMSYLYKILK